MLHAIGLCAGAFDPLARRLRDVCRPIAVDLRGHGASDSPRRPEEYAYEALAGDALAVLDALGVREALGLGNSGGGGVLLAAAVSRPGFFRRLLLFEAAATPVDPEVATRRERRLGEAARRRRTHWPSREAFVHSMETKRQFDGFDPAALVAFARWGTRETQGGVTLCCEPRVEAHYYGATLSELGAGRLVDQLASVPAHGTDSFAVRGRRSPFPEESHRLQVSLLRARELCIDADHFPPHQDLAQTEALVRTHLLSAHA
jgi:pimeloyl-ACP methyl ester carboxylesterase